MRLFSAFLAPVAIVTLAAAPAFAQECGNPALSDSESAAMNVVAARIDAALHQQLSAYQFSASNDPGGADPVWTNDEVYTSCSTRTVGYSYSGQWQIGVAGSEVAKNWANIAAENAGKTAPFTLADAGQVSDADNDRATIRLYADMTPTLEQPLPSEGSPGLAVYPTPTGAVVAFSQTPDTDNSNGVFEVKVLIGNWVLTKDDNGNPEYRPAPNTLSQPDGAKAMQLLVDGDPATLATFFKTFDGGKIGL